MQSSFRIRNVEPTDYAEIISKVDAWWGGRRMQDMLPKLFFVHFKNTSFILERNGHTLGFLIGFVSQTFPTQSYIHFVGVDPEARRTGAARALYERHFEVVRLLGCTSVHSVTAPQNHTSIEFHRRLGFEVLGAAASGPNIAVSYDGPGNDRVVFRRDLGPASV